MIIQVSLILCLVTHTDLVDIHYVAILSNSSFHEVLPNCTTRLLDNFVKIAIDLYGKSKGAITEFINTDIKFSLKNAVYIINDMHTPQLEWGNNQNAIHLSLFCCSKNCWVQQKWAHNSSKNVLQF